VGAFIDGMGAQAVAVEAQEHDRIVALTSHLPQLLSIALAGELGAALENELTCALSGTGMRSMMRLGASSWSMWKGILCHNQVNVSKEVRKLAEILGTIAEEVAQCESQSLAKRFNASAAAAARLHATDSARALR
jgi:prephenate dehydrogenase